MQTRDQKEKPVMQTRDQQYASDVFKRVMSIKDESFKTSYGSMAHSLPILIHTSGLAQALVFVASRSKKDKGLERLLEDLSKTVLNKPSTELLKQARVGSLREYLYLTEQTLAALLWYKRYAQAILDVEMDMNEGDQG
jgi:CRISPR-associated protein Cmr5